MLEAIFQASFSNFLEEIEPGTWIPLGAEEVGHGPEQHHGSTLQSPSVYTISHAVRTSGEATENPLKLEFLSSFRCKCWTLNVILFHNSSDYLTNTWWSMKTIKTWVFLRSRLRVKTSPRVIDQSYRRRWTYAAISCLILPLLNAYRNANDCASRVMQLYDS